MVFRNIIRSSTVPYEPPRLARSQKTHIIVVLLVLLLCFVVVLGKLFSLQYGDREELERRAAQMRKVKVPLHAERGSVVDRKGRQLATTVMTESVYASPPQIHSPERAATQLASCLELDSRKLATKLASDKKFVYIARKLGSEKVAAVRSLGLKGVDFLEEPKRFYPKGRLASQLIGFVGTDDTGLGGVELRFEEYLKGQDGYFITEQDSRHRTLHHLESERVDPVPGATVHLAIDEVVQHTVEKELRAAIKETQAQSAMAVVQVPATGEILGIAALPDFDPNDLKAANPNALRNPVLTDAFEPGSAMKAITASIALEEGFVTLDEIIDCENGSARMFGRRYYDYHPIGAVSFAEVVSRSSNIGAMKVAIRVPPQVFYQHLRATGIGSSTGVPFPSESAGLLKPPHRWSRTSLPSIGIGYEVAVTALQLTNVFSAIANGGVLMNPILVQSIEDADGKKLVSYEPERIRRVFSRGTVAVVQQILADAVREGTGKLAAVGGYTVAGKTGTARLIDPTTGRYRNDKHRTTFCGFAPVSNPRLTVLVVIEDPKVRSATGGSVSAPVFSRIMAGALRHLGVPRDADILDERNNQHPIADWGAALVDASLDQDDGRSGPPLPSSPDTVKPGVMPDLGGLAKVEVLEIVAELNTEWRFQGTGRAVSQQPSPGAELYPGQLCRVTFASAAFEDNET